MKLLIVCAGGYVYGLEKVTLALARELRAQGVEIQFATSSWNDGAFERLLREEGFAFEPMPLGFISKSLRPKNLWMTFEQLVRLPKLWLAFARRRRSFRPDAVWHTNFHHVIVLAPLLLRGRHFLHVHGCYAPSRKYRLLFGRLMPRLVEGFACVSEFVAERLRAAGAPAEKVSVVLNGVSFEGVAPPAREAPGSPFVVGMAGQVAPHKGAGVFVEALALLRGRGADFRALIFGQGEEAYVASLKERIAASNLEGAVSWEGYADGPGAIYPRLDALAVPSEFEEPFGMVAAEAASYGVPVVATRRGALPSIVRDGKTGFLADRGAAGQIADALEKLIRDPELWRSMSREAFGRASREFSIEASARQALALLERKNARQGPAPCEKA